MRLKRSIISLLVCLAICFSFMPVNLMAAVTLETPTGLAWNGTVATWDNVSGAWNYKCELYKNGEYVTSSGAYDPSYDFGNYMLSYGDGNYTFKITAYGYYGAESLPSESSDVYEYTRPEGSEVQSITVTGVQKPVYGEPCSTSGIVVNSDPENSVYVYMFWMRLAKDGEDFDFWSQGYEWIQLEETDTFEDGVYELFVGVSPKSGHVIDYDSDWNYQGEVKIIYTDNDEETVSASDGDYGCSFSTKMFPIGGASIPTGVWVNGEQFTEDMLTIECGSGTATLDITTSPYKLTLNNAEITKAHTGQIESLSQPLNIELIGSNSLTSSSMAIYMRYADVTFTGTGNLTTSGGDIVFWINICRKSCLR